MDGTRIKAVNNKDRNFTRASLTQFIKAADAKLEDYLQRLDKSDATERRQAARGSKRSPRFATSPNSIGGRSPKRRRRGPWLRRRRWSRLIAIQMIQTPTGLNSAYRHAFRNLTYAAMTGSEPAR